MNSINNWGAMIGSSLTSMFTTILNFIPQLIVAVIIFVVGIIVARILGRLVERLVTFTRVNQLFYRTGVSGDLAKVGININMAYFINWLVQFFIIVATLVSVADVLRFEQIALFLRNVLNFIPNVFVGVVILGIGLIGANLIGDVVSRTTSDSDRFSGMSWWLSNLARWAIIIFAFMTALIQVGVAPSLIQIIFGGLVMALSLALGLAFGLGGRDTAHDILEQTNKKMRGRA